MKTVLVDSSSAILLFKSGLFDHLATIYKVRISHSVYKELTTKVHAGSTEFKKYIQNNTITVCHPEVDNNESRISKLDAGERDTILLFQEGNGDFIMIDDGEGAGCCRQHKIQYINALLFPKILLYSGHISQTECKNKIELIMGLGRYSQEIIEYVLRCDKKKLELFLP